ncbi:MAG: hypothetical protein KIT73_04205 [Burkholderiales bacterium]|nr:hypothetical protein [Burkholderiales bacterium]
MLPGGAVFEKLQAVCDSSTWLAAVSGAAVRAPDWVGKLMVPVVIGVASAAWTAYVTVQVMEHNVSTLSKQATELSAQVTALRIETAVLKEQVATLNHRMGSLRQ